MAADNKPSGKRGKQRRHDWEAIERDYRTGKFTLRELEAKHGAGYADISRRAKREGWSKDLREAVKDATAAALIREVATQVATQAQQDTVSVVVAAAELNKQVILGHRKDLERARTTALALLDELTGAALMAGEADLLAQILAGAGAEPKEEAEARRVVAKALALPGRVSAIKAIAEALTKIHDGERRAHAIDDPAANPPPGAPGTGGTKYELTDDQLIALAAGSRG